MKLAALITALVAILFAFAVAYDAEAQQCQIKGPTCSDAKAQCRQIRKRLYPDKSNNPCTNRYRRCMDNGRWVSRTCNVPMQKS